MNLFKRLQASWRRMFPKGGSEFLCDSCKYDHPSACHRPERPNATSCPDYQRRGT